MWRKLTFFGVLGALAYVLHVVLGGILWEGYDHLQQPISDLTAQGAPDRVLLSYITGIYSLFSIIFAVSAFMYFKRSISGTVRAGFLLFTCMHIVSVLYAFFPEDLQGVDMTSQGLVHIVITGVIVPLTILSPLFVGLGFKKLEGFRGMAVYSIVTSVILLVAGGTSAFLFAQKLAYFGLFERINISSLQLWMFVTALKLFTTDPRLIRPATGRMVYRI